MASSSNRRSSSSARSRRAPEAPRRAPLAGRGGPSRRLPLPVLVAAGVAALAAVALVATLVLSRLPVFVIASIDAQATEHIDADTIARLAQVEEGTTLLNVDTGAIEEGVRKNPWAGSVRVSRMFPDRLRIVVTEREVGAIVLMGSGDVAWYLGTDGVWIEPVQLEATKSRTTAEMALARASELGCLLVTDVPSSVSPRAGYAATDDTVLAVMEYLNGFSEGFRAQISSFSAPSVDAISCTLANGVEVSLGASGDVGAKESVITQILADHPNQVTYINVRVPSSPSYRSVSATNVTSGSGARVLEDEPEDADADGSAGEGGETGDADASDGDAPSDGGSPDDGSDPADDDSGDGGGGGDIDPSLSAGY